MKIRADRFMSGHYAYFAELPERNLEDTVRLISPMQELYHKNKQYLK